MRSGNGAGAPRLLAARDAEVAIVDQGIEGMRLGPLSTRNGVCAQAGLRHLPAIRVVRRDEATGGRP
jgi:hypothetical protein